jgi:nucleotide-binding universal stress UspA family protein
MTYATLLLHLELGRSNAGLLRIAGDLAERFHASVIGVAACKPMQMLYGDGYVSGALIEQDRDEVARELKQAEGEFRGALATRVEKLVWRSTVTYGLLPEYLASEARCADLIVTGVASGDLFDSSRAVSTGDLVMRAGRPVLIVPAAATTLNLDRVLIGWNDTREARRAVADALPLLKMAANVTVAEIAREEDLPTARAHLADVVTWLERHGVEAESTASLSTGDDAAALYAIAQDQGADVIVAGAYGHSRMREWVLGGVTRDLLLSANRCSMVSH